MSATCVTKPNILSAYGKHGLWWLHYFHILLTLVSSLVSTRVWPPEITVIYQRSLAAIEIQWWFCWIWVNFCGKIDNRDASYLCTSLRRTSLDKWSGPRFSIKMPSYQYRKSHCGDKTVIRSSYLHNGISYTAKMTSLYWIRALAPTSVCLFFVCVNVAYKHNFDCMIPC